MLSDCASLTKDEKGNGMEVRTVGDRLTIALSIFVSVASISDWLWNKKLVIKWREELYSTVIE